jgi:hypothetical protein
MEERNLAIEVRVYLYQYKAPCTNVYIQRYGARSILRQYRFCGTTTTMFPSSPSFSRSDLPRGFHGFHPHVGRSATKMLGEKHRPVPTPVWIVGTNNSSSCVASHLSWKTEAIRGYPTIVVRISNGRPGGGFETNGAHQNQSWLS